MNQTNSCGRILSPCKHFENGNLGGKQKYLIQCMHVIEKRRNRNLKVGFQFLPQNRMFPLNFLERPHTSALHIYIVR